MEDLCNDIRSLEHRPDFYDIQFAALFPDRDPASTLTPAEMLRLLARMQAISRRRASLDLSGYIVAAQELRNDERAEKLAASMVLPVVNSAAVPTQSSTEPVDVPAVNTPEPSAAPVSTAPNNEITEQLSKLDIILNCHEHVEWYKKYDGGGDISQTLCSYLIHKKEYDMLEFMLDHTNYYRGTFVSAELAAAGDLDGLKWVSAKTHTPKYAIFWEYRLIVSKSTYRGHLHILVWMNQTNYDTRVIEYWDSAVSGSRLNIIQWYFIAFPDTAKSLAGKIFARAKDNHADNIVEWMIAVGLGPID